MNIRVFPDKEAIGSAAAEMIRAQVEAKPECVLGLATGSTPIPTYRALIELYHAGKIDTSRVTTYNLDEYIGLQPSHSRSYRYFMHENLFDHIPFSATHVPCGTGTHPEEDAVAYEAAVNDAVLDLQVLGIGRNGHIGFNEPAPVFSYATHIVKLTDSTIEANARFFDSVRDVPTLAITMGIGTIMRANSIILIATGEDKAEAVRAAIEGEIDPYVPASILRLHRNCTFLLDEAAASLLK